VISKVEFRCAITTTTAAIKPDKHSKGNIELEGTAAIPQATFSINPLLQFVFSCFVFIFTNFLRYLEAKSA